MFSPPPNYRGGGLYLSLLKSKKRRTMPPLYYDLPKKLMLVMEG
jgi:hypothetical protein